MKEHKTPLKSVMIYLVITVLWFAIYDNIFGMADIKVTKGVLYVVFTSFFIYFLLFKEFRKVKNLEDNLFGIVNIIKSCREAIISQDLEGNITSWNSGAEQLLGYNVSEVIGKKFSCFLPEDKEHIIPIVLNKVKLGEVVDSFQIELINKYRQSICVSVTMSPIKNKKGDIVGTSIMAIDITKQREHEDKLQLSYQELNAVYEQLIAAEEELRAQYEELQHNQQMVRKSEERYKLAIEGANDVIWELNLENYEFFSSSKWSDLTGYNVSENMTSMDVIKKVIFSEDRQKFIQDLRAHVKEKDSFYHSEFRIITKSDEIKWVYNRGKVLKDESGRPYLMAGSLTDINERKQREEQIEQMAYYDAVTELPNRVLFLSKLDEEIKKIKKTNQKGAVFFLDIDDFKKINDTLGHDYGDKLLKLIAKTLSSSVKNKNNMVARFGGDEFLILIPEVESHTSVIEVANHILGSFYTPFNLEGKLIYVTCSIGVGIYPNDGETVNMILKNVDTATYAAKGNGKNQYYFFDQKISEAILRKSEIEKGLREALGKDEIYLNYQPQIDAKTGEFYGIEALIRWDSKELGKVSPYEFIPVAEETGLIVPIGEWILRRACIECKELRSKGYNFKTLSVNVSGIQLQQQDFITLVAKVLNETDLEPSSLEIEITESVLMKHLEYSIELIKELKNIGVRTALDDFGTGYSSLNYLRKLPINTLKIDKSFIDDICVNEYDKDITDGIIQLAHKINLGVIIEGVEDREQVKLLMDMKCNVIQGYYFSKPLSKEDLEKLLEKGKVEL